MLVPSVRNASMPLPEPPSFMMVLASQGMVAPVVGSRDPMPLAATPFRVGKLPPTITREFPGAIAIESTLLSSAVGAQGRTAPFDAANAARRRRLDPLALKNEPPAYTVVFVAAMAATRADTDGWNDVSNAPVAVLNAAMCERAWPSTVVKSPPT